MNRLFGKKKEAPPAPSLEECSKGVDNSIQSIRTKSDECAQELAKLNEQYKKTKSPALRQRMAMVLKRKKMYDQQLGTLYNQSFTVEQAAFMGQQIQTTAQTVSALKQTVAVTKAAYKNLNVGDFEKVMDEMEDIMLDQEEINDIMNRNMGFEVDENELEAELAGLNEEMALDNLNEKNMAPPSYLPNAPMQEKSQPMLN